MNRDEAVMPADAGLAIDFPSLTPTGDEAAQEDPIAWRFKTGATSRSTITSLLRRDDGDLILLAGDSVHSIDGGSGRGMWEFGAPGGSLLDVAPTDVLILQENTIYSVNAKTARVEWQRSISDSAKILVEGEAVIYSEGTTVRAVNVTTGSDLWRLDDVPRGPEFFPGDGVVALLADGRCRVLAASSGSELLRIKITFGAFIRVFRDTLYLVDGDRISAFDLRTGNKEWSHTCVRKIVSVHPSNSHLTYTDIHGVTGVVDVQFGELLWEVDGMSSTVFVGPEFIVLQPLPVLDTAAYHFSLQTFQTETGREIWRYDTDRPEYFWSVSLVGGGAYLGIVSSSLLDHLRRTDQIFPAEPFDSRPGVEHNTLILLQPATGEVLSSIAPPENFASFLVSGKLAYFVTETGLLAYSALGVVLPQRETRAPEPVAGGAISVSTNPTGARIYLNGKYVGETLFDTHQLNAGIHEIMAKLAGHATVRERVLIEPGRSETLHLLLDRELSVLWEASLEEIAPVAILADRGVVVGTGSGGAIALDAESGDRLWFNLSASDEVVSVSHNLFTWATGKELGATELHSGVLRWRHQYQGEVRWLAVADFGVIAFDSSGVLHAIDMETGVENWRRTTKSEYSTALVEGEALFLWERRAGCLAVDANTGRTMWRTRSDGEHVLLSVAGTREAAKVFSYDVFGGTLRTLNAQTGEVAGIERAVSRPDLLDDEYLVYHKEWELGGEPFVMVRWNRLAPVPGAGGAIMIDDVANGARILSMHRGIAYMADRSRLSAVSFGQKATQWRVRLPGITTVHHLLDDLLLIPVDRTLFALDGKTGRTVWEFELPSIIESITVHHDEAYLLSGDTIYKVVSG